MLEKGITGFKEEIVVYEKTAKAMGSGELEVYSTPSMILLMEFTAKESVRDKTENGEPDTTVGTKLSVEHLSATPVGKKVWCESVLTEINGRELVFEVTVYDEAGVIGKGTHHRFLVNSEKFLAKLAKKYQS